MNISRIALKLHSVPKFELDAVIGQKGRFCKGLNVSRETLLKIKENRNSLATKTLGHKGKTYFSKPYIKGRIHSPKKLLFTVHKK